MTKPWRTIQAGVKAASNGAIVAVAAGQYAENVRIQGKHVRLWGRCPAMVELSGISTTEMALQIFGKPTSTTEVHNIAVTGASGSIHLSGSIDALIMNVWVHDARAAGLVASDVLGYTSVKVPALAHDVRADVASFAQPNQKPIHQRGIAMKVKSNVKVGGSINTI